MCRKKIESGGDGGGGTDYSIVGGIGKVIEKSCYLPGIEHLQNH